MLNKIAMSEGKIEHIKSNRAKLAAAEIDGKMREILEAPSK